MDESLLPRWVSFDRDLQTLSEFLAQSKPSMTMAPSTEWICVSRLQATRKDINRGAKLSAAWEALCEAKKNRVQRSDLLKLACEYKVKSGKWLIYVSSAEVDSAWKVVANAIIVGQLGDDAKVSTNHCATSDRFAVDCKEKPLKKRKKSDNEPQFSHVICVYSSNYDDIDAVFDL